MEETKNNCRDSTKSDVDKLRIMLNILIDNDVELNKTILNDIIDNAFGFNQGDE